jgi:hypothetical protein
MLGNLLAMDARGLLLGLPAAGDTDQAGRHRVFRLGEPLLSVKTGR